MLSRLQELRKEEETLLRVKEALHDQLTRLKVEELALRSMINAREGTMFTPSAAVTEEHVNSAIDQMLAGNMNPSILHHSIRTEEASWMRSETSSRKNKMDNEMAINQTKLQLQVHGDDEEEEEEEEEESDS